MVKLILYDISNDRPRTHLARWLDAEGFDRIQYSVFVGKTTRYRWDKLYPELQEWFEEHCQTEDRLYAIVLDSNHFRRTEMLGVPLDTEWILQTVDAWFPMG